MGRAFIVGIALMLGGCASAHWAPGPNVTPSLTFEQQQAQCRYMARHGGSGMVVAGDPAFVAGASVGHGISETVRSGADYVDCMKAAGYVRRRD